MVICFDWEPLIYILSSQRAAGAGKRYEKYINITHEHLTQKPQYVLCGPVGSNGCFPLQKRLLTPLCRYLLCFTCISVLLWGDGIEGLLFQAANRVVTRIIRLCNDFSGIHYGDFLFPQLFSRLAAEYIHTGCLLIHFRHTTVCRHSGRSFSFITLPEYTNIMLRRESL